MKENTQGVLYSDPGQRVLYAFFTRSLRVFYLAQNRGLRRKQVVRCGPPQPPGCGAGLEVWQFAVACVPRATRHGRAIPEHTAPAESAHARFLFVCSVATPTPFVPWPVCASMGVVLRLGRPLPPGFYHVFIAFFTRFFTPITASAFFTRFLRVFYAFFSFLGPRLATCTTARARPESWASGRASTHRPRSARIATQWWLSHFEQRS